MRTTVKLDAEYLSLLRRFPLRPIRSDRQLQAAMAVINSLVDKAQLTVSESDYLDVLSDLVEKYERVEHPIAPAPDHAMLRHLMESHSLTQLDVARGTGIVHSTISSVLARKRTLTRQHVARLARFFKIPPDVFALGD